MRKFKILVYSCLLIIYTYIRSVPTCLTSLTKGCSCEQRQLLMFVYIPSRHSKHRFATLSLNWIPDQSLRWIILACNQCKCTFIGLRYHKQNGRNIIPSDNFLLIEGVLEILEGGHSFKLLTAELSSSSLANKELLYQASEYQESSLQSAGSGTYLSK